MSLQHPYEGLSTAPLGKPCGDAYLCNCGTIVFCRARNGICTSDNEWCEDFPDMQSWSQHKREEAEEKRQLLVRPSIAIDVREENPYEFDESIKTVRFDLPSRDYSIYSLEEYVALRNLTLDDFINTAIHQWTRFRDEFEILDDIKFSAVVIECSLVDISQGEYRSKVNPREILGICTEISVDYGIPVLFWGDRETAARMTEETLLGFASKCLKKCDAYFSDEEEKKWRYLL